MHFMHFTKMRNKTVDINVGYKDNLTSNISHTKFFGIILDSTLTWSNHIDLSTKQLSTACYVINP